MLLENNILKLRALEPFDLDLLYEWENNTTIWDIGNTLAPVSKYILHQYIENSRHEISENKQLRLIIEQKETIPFLPIGTVDLFDIDFYHKRAGIGILIASDEHRKKGYARQAIALLESYAYNKLGLLQIYCHIQLNNTVSLKLFESAGYTISGKLINWHWSIKGMQDVYILQHLLY
jgi:diamine N-acetyltransferase